MEQELAPELLASFPPEAEIVRVPAGLDTPLDVDFWTITFFRRDAHRAFAALRGVRVVQCLMAGVDWITPWLPRDVTLCDGRGLHDSSTAEWAVAAVLASLKRFPSFRDLQNRGVWGGQANRDPELLHPLHTSAGPQGGLYRVLVEELAGKTVLIVGYGSIGAAIERRLTGFDVHFLRIARSARAAEPFSGAPEVHAIGDLHELLPQADVVILIVPLTPDTRGLVGARELALLRPGALLVNAARGPVVDTGALVEALTAHRLRAALDVTDPEPLPPDHPLWSAPNLLLTPHVAGSTPDFIHRAFSFAGEQVRRYLAGELLENVVGPGGY